MDRDVQIISGDYVLLPRIRYDQLLEQARRHPLTEAEQDRHDADLVNDMLESVRNGSLSMIPAEVVDLVLDGGHSRVRAWRLYRDMTLADLAKKTRLTASYISQIELGKRAASMAVLKKLAKALGTGIDALLAD
ncbi:MAG TPA: helix-turn-helix transcriptional regulator [Alphaproteobacteria bacterium]|nr:helix-turn-helix transcriptional regulator [Alphaproteobacteria bacterium]